MKKIKMIFIEIAVLIITGLCGIRSFALPTDYFDDSYLNSFNFENSVVVTDINGNIYVCCTDDSESMEIRELKFSYGIVIEVEENVSLEELNLDYQFVKGSFVTVKDTAMSVMVSDINSNSYIYNVGASVTDDQIDELSKYTSYLLNTEGVTRAEMFQVVGYNKGWFLNCAENNATVYINNSENIIDLDQLNANIEINEFLKNVGAEIELLNDGNTIAITGIDNREKVIEIRDTLNTFDIICGKAYIQTNMLVTSSGGSVSYATPVIKLLGDADNDNELTTRDCAFIAATLAQGKNDELTDTADFNNDGEVNVRDAAAIARELAEL